MWTFGLIVGALAAAASVSLWLWMRSASDPLRLADGYIPCRILGRAPDPILCLQLARTGERTTELLRVWQQHIPRLDRLLKVDYAFALAYAVFCILASLALGQWLGFLGLHAGLADGFAFALLAALAAVLDAGENTALLVQIRDVPTTPLAVAAFVCALGKFALLALVAIWLIAGTLVAVFASLAEIAGSVGL